MKTDLITVPGTIGLAAAAGPWECVVVGAGPAGAAAALRLARNRVRVLLVDRANLPRGKVCGCCLSPAALKELTLLGLEAIAAGAGQPLKTLALSSGGWTARLPFRGGVVISRERLDRAIVEAGCAAGVEWLPGVDVAAATVGADGAVAVSLRGVADGAVVTIRSERLILATGLVDRVRGDADDRVEPCSRGAGGSARCLIGVGTTLPADASDLPPGELRMRVGLRGYCGLVRLEDSRIDVAAALDRAAVRAAGGPVDALLALFDNSPDAGGSELVASLRAARLTATPPLTRRAPPSSWQGRILRVGDAAAYVEPFTGEGIGWALASARLAADTILQGAGGARVGEVYAGAHQRHFVAPHARCRRVVSWLRSPALVTAAVASARIVPRVAARIVPLFVGAGARGGAS